MFKRLLTVALTGLAAVYYPASVRAQADVHFSQFYQTSILRNPALTGVFAEDYKAGAVYRNQWSSIANPFQTAVVMGEGKVDVGKGEVTDFLSFGVLAYYDEAGSIDRKILTVYPAINYNKSLEDAHNSFLSLGFTAGYNQYSYDPSKATFNNQYQNNAFNASNPTGENLRNPTLAMWDMGAGVNFNSSAGEYQNVTYMIGVAAYHLTQPRYSFDGDPNINMEMRWNVNGAVSGKFNDQYSYQLQANYAMQGTFNEIIAGGLINWHRISSSDYDMPFTIGAGAFYRVNDAIIPTITVQYAGLSFGVSYDVNISTLMAASNLRGGYELSIFKSGMFKDQNEHKSKVLCPNFY